VVTLAQFGKSAGVTRDVANDSRRQLRLGALEGQAPTLIHELAQPLSATSNYLESCAGKIRQRIEGLEDVLAEIEKAKAQAARATQIIRSMRNFALSGEVSAESEELRRMVDLALAEVPGMEEVDVSLSYHAAGVYVIVDRIQFGQVLTNLFTNAVDAMRDSPIKRLRIATSGVGGDCTRIRIEDSGPGLSPEVYARLYEPFVTTKPQGTGLGLPICDEIVRAHDGRLWAEKPEAGCGAAFNLLLPARMRGPAL
jgi:two-component system sensor kinase FixL